MYLIFEVLMLLSMGGLIFAFQGDFSGWVIYLKCLSSFFFVLAGICGYIRTKQNRKISGTMLAALVCSMAGDVFLALDKEEGILFVLGVASFAFAHIMFAISFSRISSVAKGDLLGTFLIFAVEMFILCYGNFEFQGLFPVLAIYAAIISFMVSKALSLWKCRLGKERGVCLIMIGSVLFLISDNLLLFWLFGIGIPKELQSANWLLYYLAQGCLSAALSVGLPVRELMLFEENK